jgi:hypothetical protein
VRKIHCPYLLRSSSLPRKWSEQEFLPPTVKTVDLKMSYDQDVGSSRGKQPADDYFSRQIVPHISWTGDLINVDSNEHGDLQVVDDEGQRKSQEPLSPLESDLLTPATLSPPVENTETTPLLQTRSNPTTAYASNDMPVVCCRAGPRPANISSDNHGYSAAPFQDRPPQSMSHSIYYRRTGQDLEQNKLPSFRRRRRRQSRGCCGSKYMHRWVLALSLMATLFLLQYLCLGEDATESSCTLPYCSEALTHSFDNISTFSFSEDLQIPGLSIRGVIRLEPAPEDQESQVVVVVSYATSRNRRASPQWELSDTSIRLQAPIIAKQGKSFLPRIFDPCLSISATIYLHANTTLQTFQIDTTYLSITSSPNLFPRPPTGEANQRDEIPHPLIDLTSLQTTAHPITLPHWTSRQTMLQTRSSAIAGTFTHLDLISLTSTSGSVTASIIPGEADSSKPLPALLKIQTTSGSVRVTYPSIDVSSSSSSTSTIPARDYETHIQTSSGSISGSYLFSSAADLVSRSGSITAGILYAPKSSSSSSYNPRKETPINELRTSSHSGATDIRISHVGRRSVKGKGGSLRSVHGAGDGVSGSVRAKYPADWEGRIEAESASGNVRVGGEGVVVDKEERLGGKKRVRAHRKGEGEDGSGSSIEARTGSGSVEVFVGGW